MVTQLPHVPGFLITAMRGSGGMGRVFLAHSPRHGQVALKLLDPLRDDGTYRRRLAHEVTLARRVDSGHIAAVLDADLEAEQPWVAMEYVDGPTLAEQVEGSGPLTVPLVLEVIRQTAQALVDIHAVDIVHRDLKPSNIICGVDGVVRVTDFGIATAAETTQLTATGQRVGTLAYTAPEQFKGEVATAASDIFALGAVAYFASTGRSLFGGGPDGEVIGRILSGRHGAEDVAHKHISDLITACLRRDPRLRPQAAGVVVHCSRALAAQPAEPSVAVDETVTRRQAAGRLKTRGPGPWRLVIVALGVIGLLTGASLSAWRWMRPSPSPPTVTAAPQPYPQGNRVRISWAFPGETTGAAALSVNDASAPQPCPTRVTTNGACTFVGSHATDYEIALRTSQPGGPSPDPVRVRTFDPPRVVVRSGDKVKDAGDTGCVVLVDAFGLKPSQTYKITWTTDLWEAQGRRPQPAVLDRPTNDQGNVASAALLDVSPGAAELAYGQSVGGWVRVQVDDLPPAVKNPWGCP